MAAAKPEFLYHASPTGGIALFVPQRRSTPMAEHGASPARIYAAKDPAYACGHGFAWGTEEGFDLGFIQDDQGRERLVFAVPAALIARLEQPVFLYTLPGAGFTCLDHVGPFGHNFASATAVSPIDVVSFATVRTAIEDCGGTVVLKDAADGGT